MGEKSFSVPIETHEKVANATRDGTRPREVVSQQIVVPFSKRLFQFKMQIGGKTNVPQDPITEM